jgi:hypothetical protein
MKKSKQYCEKTILPQEGVMNQPGKINILMIAVVITVGLILAAGQTGGKERLAYETAIEASRHNAFDDLAAAALGMSALSPVREQRLNRETDNLNVLFAGIGDEELMMVALYSIDYQETWRSAAIFFPVRATTAFPGQEAEHMLYRIYQAEGVEGLVKALEEKLEVKINYYIEVDRKILIRVAEIIDPIYVEGEAVDITNLFDMEVTPHDDYILGELVKQFRKPAVYFFALPELFFSFRRYISTDFAITPSNLYLHFKVARGIDPSLLTKTIVSGWDYYHRGEWIRVIPEDVWKNIVYRLTKEHDENLRKLNILTLHIVS